MIFGNLSTEFIHLASPFLYLLDMSHLIQRNVSGGGRERGKEIGRGGREREIVNLQVLLWCSDFIRFEVLMPFLSEETFIQQSQPPFCESLETEVEISSQRPFPWTWKWGLFSFQTKLILEGWKNCPLYSLKGSGSGLRQLDTFCWILWMQLLIYAVEMGSLGGWAHSLLQSRWVAVEVGLTRCYSRLLLLWFIDKDDHALKLFLIVSHRCFLINFWVECTFWGPDVRQVFMVFHTY